MIRRQPVHVVYGGAHLFKPDVAKKLGGIALAAYTGGVSECTLYYDNVVVTALEPAAANLRER